MTAETMSQTYGGDAPCALGHFYTHVLMTNSWTTHTIMWNEFTSPNYMGDDCAAAGVTSHPLQGQPMPTGKMQAIDWGFYATCTNVDVLIDNVRLVP